MAKRLTTNEILNLDISTFNKLSESELRKAVGTLASTANKRLRAFERAGESSPAYRYIMSKSSGRFTTAGKDLNSLRSEFMRIKNFLESKTGSVTKWRAIKQESIKSLGYKGIQVTEEQFGNFWRAYEDLKELDPSVSAKSLKYIVLQDIAAEMLDETATPDEIATRINESMARIYEREQERENDGRGVSSFFGV